ncbi:MAG TPA: LUD domain-containing protein [Acidobacteriaceae bacterium]|nr:LUD domain-containing protein [Acidobacteriaceae bacterium]
MSATTSPGSASARAEVLRRIRIALGDVPRIEEQAIHAEWEAIPRDYIRSATRQHATIIELLEDRLRDYDATVVRAQLGTVSAQITRMLRDRKLRSLVVPAGLGEALGEPLPAGFEFLTDTVFSPAELDAFDGVVTAATLAIAETGTIVLQNVPGQGRRAPTLVPDYHLCIVRAADVVETVPEAFARLAATADLATTFISGPSATADIEMTRIKGVHGPRTLDVILV